MHQKYSGFFHHILTMIDYYKHIMNFLSLLYHQYGTRSLLPIVF